MLAEAELVLAVFDQSRPFDNEDSALLERLKTSGGVKIALLNKKDLPGCFDMHALTDSGIFSAVLEISASENDGLDALRAQIESLYAAGEIDYNNRAVITTARQNASVTRALAYVRSAMAQLEGGFSADMAGFDLEAALSELSELDGRMVSEEIVDAIFHRFCVGK
jgi:tRNA modification GTPase